MKRIAALILVFCLCGNLCACGEQTTPTEPTKETIILTPENIQDYLLIEPEAANYEASTRLSESLGIILSSASVDCIIHIDKKVPCELSNVKFTLSVCPDWYHVDEQTCEIQLPVDGKKTVELSFWASACFSEPEKFIIEITDVSGSVEIEK